MKVYLVYKYELDETDPFQGVFSSRKMAEAFVETQCTGGDTGFYSIKEEVVDSAI